MQEATLLGNSHRRLQGTISVTRVSHDLVTVVDRHPPTTGNSLITDTQLCNPCYDFSEKTGQGTQERPESESMYKVHADIALTRDYIIAISNRNGSDRGCWQ
jgi:hypothetical protein